MCYQLPGIIGVTFTGLIIRISLKSPNFTNSLSSNSRQVVTVGTSSRYRRDANLDEMELGSRGGRDIAVHVDVDRFVDTQLDSTDQKGRDFGKSHLAL